MTTQIIRLDDRRTCSKLIDAERRRDPYSLYQARQLHLESLEDQMRTEPAMTWTEAIHNWRVLLEQYAASPRAGNVRLEKLIRRTLDDLARLKNRED